MTSPAAPPLWELRLDGLLNVLTTDLHDLDHPGIWLSRRLRSGFTFSLMLAEDGSRRARLSIEDRPVGEAAWKRHHEAIEVMVQHIGCSAWPFVAPSLAPGEQYIGAIVELQEKLIT